MKRILILLMMVLVTTLSFPSLGRCPNIEGHFTPDGERNKDSFIIIKKLDCALFSIIPGLGEETFTIKVGAVENCDDSVLKNVCYSGNILDANEVIFNLKETLKFDNCVREEILKINEARRTIERDIKVNCGKRGISTYPKIIFHKMGKGV